MLVLSRRLNEKILLPGMRTSIQVLALRAGEVRLGIDAPPEVTILREEVPDRDAPRPVSAVRRAAAPAQPDLGSRFKAISRGLGLARLQAHASQRRELHDTLEQLQAAVQLLCREFEQPAAPRPLRRRAAVKPTNRPEPEALFAGCLG